jgi:putative transcriptional regulator
MKNKHDLVELRRSTGMNRREFSDYFGIPYRTIQEWELGNRKMPEYLYRLMEYRLRVEGKSEIIKID